MKVKGEKAKTRKLTKPSLVVSPVHTIGSPAAGENCWPGRSFCFCLCSKVTRGTWIADGEQHIRATTTDNPAEAELEMAIRGSAGCS